MIVSEAVCEYCQGPLERLESTFGFCARCQHWTAGNIYADVAHSYHTNHYATHNQNHIGSFEELKKQWRTNITIIKKHIKRGRALEIGCLEGAGVAALKDAGFDCWGFDVSNGARVAAEANGITADRIIIAPEFRVDLMPFLLDLITLREVIEHVPDPVGLLDDIRHSIKPSGILQVQTPRFHPDVRMWDNSQHLRIYSTSSLLRELELSGFEACDLLQWHGGVCVTARPV